MCETDIFIFGHQSLDYTPRLKFYLSQHNSYRLRDVLFAPSPVYVTHSPRGARSISIVTASAALGGGVLDLSVGYRSHALRAASAMRGLFQNSRERTSFRR